MTDKMFKKDFYVITLFPFNFGSSPIKYIKLGNKFNIYKEPIHYLWNIDITIIIYINMNAQTIRSFFGNRTLGMLDKDT